MKNLKIIFVDFNGTMDTPYVPKVYTPKDHTIDYTADNATYKDHTLGIGHTTQIEGRKAVCNPETGYWEWSQDSTKPTYRAPNPPVVPQPECDVHVPELLHPHEPAPADVEWDSSIPEPAVNDRGDAWEENLVELTVADFAEPTPERKPVQMSLDDMMKEADEQQARDMADAEQRAEELRQQHEIDMAELDGYLEAKTKTPTSFPGTSRGRADVSHGYYGRGVSHYDHTEHAYQGLTTTYHYGADKESAKLLQELCEKTGAKIVYSTTQRMGGWESCAKYLGIPLEHSLGFYGYLGVTPDIPWGQEESSWYKRIPVPFVKKKKSWGSTGYKGYEKPRQKEIQAWLKACRFLDVKNFVILDDDKMDDPWMAKHWVASVKENHFRQAEYEQALKILSK